VGWNRVTLWLAGAAALFFAGCAAGGGPGVHGAGGDLRADLLSEIDWAPPEGQTCNITPPDEPLPSPDEVLDHQTLAAALLKHDAGAPAYALLTLSFDTLGANRWVTRFEGDLGAPDTGGLEELVRAALHVPSPVRLLRLRIDRGDSVEVQVGRSETCIPTLRNQLEVSRLAQQALRRIDGRGTAVLHVFVTTAGMPQEIRLAESSGNDEVDAAALDMGRFLRFNPALSNRVPVPVWVRAPITFRTRR
jgi:TonB family protein